MEIQEIKTTDDLIQFLDAYMRDVEARKEREEKWRKEHPCCDNCRYSLHEYGDVFCNYWENHEIDNPKIEKCGYWR